MPRRYLLCTQILCLGIAVVGGLFALPGRASGQTPGAELPADCSAYASVPLPPEAEKAPVPKTFPACASYRSYRRIGRPVNYPEARACAWQERLAQQVLRLRSLAGANDLRS